MKSALYGRIFIKIGKTGIVDVRFTVRFNIKDDGTTEEWKTVKITMSNIVAQQSKCPIYYFV